MAVISQYQVVIPGQTITAALWNGMELNIINNGLIPGGIEDYSSTDGQMQTMTDPFPASSISRATSLAGELERIRWQFDNIIGGSNWYEDPPVDITTFKTRFDAHTHDGTANNGPQIQAGGLASNAVTTAKILDANVTTAKLAANAVTANELASNAVTTAKILDSNVTTVKIADANVTEAKLSSSVAGNGLAGGAGTALSVNVDNSTLEINADTVRVKDSGITGAKLSPTYTISTRPAFLARPTSNVNNATGDGTVYTVICNTEIFDLGSNYNNTTGTFTAPVAGVYLFAANVYLDNAGNNHNVFTITINAGSYTFQNSRYGALTNLDDTILETHCICYLNQNDTVTVSAMVSGSLKQINILTSTGFITRFSGALLF